MSQNNDDTAGAAAADDADQVWCAVFSEWVIPSVGPACFWFILFACFFLFCGFVKLAHGVR